MDSAMDLAGEAVREVAEQSLPRPPTPPQLQQQCNVEVERLPKEEEEENTRWVTEQVESMYRYYLEEVDWKSCSNEDFNGFCSEEHDRIIAFSDKKSEILFGIFKTMISVVRDGIFKNRNGIFPFGVNGTKAFLIYKKFFEHLEKLNRNENKKPEQALKETSKLKLNPVLPRCISVAVRSPPPLSAGSATSQRLIQTPKRYLDGGTNQQLGKRQPPKDKQVFEMGLLPPKYPKLLEESPGIRDYTASNDPSVSKNQGNKVRQKGNALGGLFEISRLLQSGELERSILVHQMEETNRKQKLLYDEAVIMRQLDAPNAENERIQQKRLEEERLERNRFTEECMKMERMEQTRIEEERLRKDLRTKLASFKLEAVKDFAYGSGRTQLPTSKLECVCCGKSTCSDTVGRALSNYLCSSCANVTSPRGFVPKPDSRSNYTSRSPSTFKIQMMTPAPPLTPVTSLAGTSQLKGAKRGIVPEKINQQQANLKMGRPSFTARVFPREGQWKMGMGRGATEATMPKVPLLTGRTFKKREDLLANQCSPTKLMKPAFLTNRQTHAASVYKGTKDPQEMSVSPQKQSKPQQLLLPSLPPLTIFPQQMKVVSYGNQTYMVLEQSSKMLENMYVNSINKNMY